MKKTHITTEELQSELTEKLAQKQKGCANDETFEERIRRIGRYPIEEQTLKSAEQVSWMPARTHESKNAPAFKRR